jgi:hypothetical protein
MPTSRLIGGCIHPSTAVSFQSYKRTREAHLQANYDFTTCQCHQHVGHMGIPGGRNKATAQRVASSRVETGRNDDQVWIELHGDGHYYSLKGIHVISIAHTAGSPRDIDVPKESGNCCMCAASQVLTFPARYQHRTGPDFLEGLPDRICRFGTGEWTYTALKDLRRRLSECHYLRFNLSTTTVH